MRLGGSIMRPYHGPEEWLKEVKNLTYSTVIFPVDSFAPLHVQDEYAQCCRENDLVIGEVGVWKNVLSSDENERRAAIDYAKAQLHMAERVGANCCVNIVGSLSPTLWDGYAPGNYAKETYDEIIRITREIIDDVNPRVSSYSLEPMPWMIPDSPQQYLQLIRDMDRSGFSVHLDFANMINGIERYHHAEEFIRSCFTLLGKHIRSIHLKDVKLGDELPCCIREVQLGQGALPLHVALEEAEKLGEDTTVFTEHYDHHENYVDATAYLRALGKKHHIHIK